MVLRILPQPHGKVVPTHSKNRPSLVAYDLRKHAPANVVYDSLFNRGILKLFFIREAAHGLLDLWLRIGREAGMNGKRHSKDYWHGYRQATLDARADLKKLLEMPKQDCPVSDPEIMLYMIRDGFNESH